MGSYLSIAIFIIFALFIPASLILFSKLIRIQDDVNQVSQLNFESGERTSGKRISVMGEYLHYFSSFLAFELIGAVILIWVGINQSLSATLNIEILSVALFGFLLQMFVILIARHRE